MKTLKRFFITNMFKRHKILGICLILTALFAHTAHAQETITIGVDPGPEGGQAYDFAFNVPVAGTNSIKLEFFDNKTLKAGPGITGFMFTGITDKGIPYSGVLLDANGEEIPGTEFDGVTSFDGAEIDFQEATVWSSILFKDGAFLLGPHWLFWVAGNPVVGGPDGEPEPVTIGGTVSGLFEGGVLALQNNSADDLEITEDGPFTFEMPLDPDTDYNVTVLTQPEGQSCSVENGSGTVPEVDVTDVAVTCEELVVGDVSKVAAEGDILPDKTTLEEILLEGGVAINVFGEVAFHGQTSSIDAVFTQNGLVAKEGDTLPDNTVVNRINDRGKVAIDDLGEVAFHGRDDVRNEAVFTQDWLVAKEGDTLTEITELDEINERGGVARWPSMDESRLKVGSLTRCSLRCSSEPTWPSSRGISWTMATS